MDNFEKVEKLVAKSGVSYEEAKRALDEANGDLLDAMILLEREGKAQAPKKSSFSTQYEGMNGYEPVTTLTDGREKAGSEKKGGKFKEFCSKVWHAVSVNYLVVERKGEPFVKMPLWVMILLLLAFWHIGLLVVIVSLFFGFTYRFTGEADMKGANTVMEKASNVAEKVKEEIKK